MRHSALAFAMAITASGVSSAEFVDFALTPQIKECEASVYGEYNVTDKEGKASAPQSIRKVLVSIIGSQTYISLWENGEYSTTVVSGQMTRVSESRTLHIYIDSYNPLGADGFGEQIVKSESGTRVLTFMVRCP